MFNHQPTDTLSRSLLYRNRHDRNRPTFDHAHSCAVPYILGRPGLPARRATNSTNIYKAPRPCGGWKNPAGTRQLSCLLLPYRVRDEYATGGLAICLLQVCDSRPTWSQWREAATQSVFVISGILNTAASYLLYSSVATVFFKRIGRVSYIRIYLCYFCFRWKTVSLVQASMQHFNASCYG